MYKIIKKVIEHRKITLFFTAVIIFAGFYAYYLLPRQENPTISTPVAMVITPYPGASASDVKELVTQKMEDELAGLDGYDYCKGISKENVSIVIVYFFSDVDNDRAMQDVRNAVNDVQDDLPAGALDSTLNTDLAESAGILISVSGEHYSYEQLASFGEKFKNELRNIEGITKVELIGQLDKEVRVDLNIERLNQLGLSIADVSTILAAQNVQIPSGSIDYQSGKITVNIPGNFTSVDDIKQAIISVSPASGVVTRIKDIATVQLVTEEGTQKIKADGQNAVILAGYFVENRNVVLIGEEVRQALDRVKAGFPPDLAVNEVVYQPDSVSNSTNEFMLHLVIGIVLVLGAVFWAMGIRNALVVSTAIPISILFTFIMMYFYGVQIHQVSLVALIMALGILVDDAIVVSDNIQVHLDAAEERLLAAYNGATRCTIPNLAATMAIIVAFAPLLGTPGQVGQFLYALPWVVIVSVAASYFVAMFVIPSMMTDFARINPEPAKQQERKIRVFFQKLLLKGLKRKGPTVAGAVLALVFVLVIVLPQLHVQFFPYATNDIFYIELNSEKPGDLEATEKLADEVTALLKTVPEVVSSTVSVGDGLPKFYVTMMPPMPSDDYAQIAVKFDLQDRQRFKNSGELAEYLQTQLNQNISGGICKIKLLEYAFPTEAKVIVRVSGEDIQQLVRTAGELRTEIAQIPGTTNVRDNWDDDRLQLSVEIDEDKASSFGVSSYDVQKEINLALYGQVASVFRKNGHEYNIKVKSDINTAAMLENFAIKSSLTGQKIPLKEFAAISYSSKASTIRTYNGDLAIDILADPLPGYSGTGLENQIEAEILPGVDLTKVKVNFFGEREDIRENFSAIGVLAVVAIFVIYAILLLVFNSFIQPLVILTTIPLSLIGSLLGLFIFGQPMSFTAFLGIIALVGLVVKNGILLIDFINEARRDGYTVEQACIDGVSRRFNAVIISALTVILALIPLAVSGNDLFSPMAISLMSGLTVSTFLTMVIVPVIYSLIEKDTGQTNVQ